MTFITIWLGSIIIIHALGTLSIINNLFKKKYPYETTTKNPGKDCVVVLIGLWIVIGGIIILEGL